MKILLLEDTDDDKKVVEDYAMDDPGVELEVAQTQEQIEERLEAMIDDPGAIPGMFLLDLAIDGVTDVGLQVLRKVRSLPQLRHVPVVIFSQSKLDQLIFEAYSAGANSYIHKTIEENTFRDRVANVLDAWKNDTKLPDVTFVTVEHGSGE